ncbi:hypothetical protein BJP35_2336 [Enterobacter sp. J49]|uniref:hypothetical protein n=1 Tax=Enterobacter sp. J49 TaxID=1903627 RepID=UPI000A371F4C|nr:hypothetical protein [Enterobacter sp. J49]OUC37071.1 hypothetical protein BJP35_2336 [Enterobacter sp. J49]
MKPITIAVFMATLFSAHASALSERIHCEGHFTAVLNDADDPVSFNGEYIWDILQDAPSYISLEGELLQPPKKYTVQRTFNLKVRIINIEDSIYELTPLNTTVQGADNLPDSVALRHLFHGPRIYRIQKTLVSSYLISNASSPVFICHDIN